MPNFTLTFLLHTNEFECFLAYFLGALLLTAVLVGLSFVVQLFLYQPYGEKLSPYECGFQPFQTPKSFTIHYYLISLIFILFDIEVVFLIPVAFLIDHLLTFSIFITIILFNTLLWIGYWIEYHTDLLSLEHIQ